MGHSCRGSGGTKTDTGEQEGGNFSNVAPEKPTKGGFSVESGSRFVGFIGCFTVSVVSAAASQRQTLSPLLSARLSPLSQLFPPNPSGQSQLKEPHRFTQVPPFTHGLALQKCLLAEQPGGQGEKPCDRRCWITITRIRLRHSDDPTEQTEAAGSRPGRVPLLAMKLAMSTCWLSTRRLFMQPTNCRLRTGKSSGSFGTPPRSRGPVRSSDLRRSTVTPTPVASWRLVWGREGRSGEGGGGVGGRT